MNPNDNPLAVLTGSATARWCVVEGDNSVILPMLAAGSIDHVICDPPYSEHVHSKSLAGARKTPLADGSGRRSKSAISREVDFGFAAMTMAEREAFADQCERVCRRWALVFSDVESSHLWRGELTAVGMDYCRTGAWIKVGATPQFTGDRPGVGFEAITICHAKGKKRWNGGGAPAVWTHLTCIDRGSPAQTNNERMHPTQKPLPLMLELVSLFTDPDDLILDPYCGSGTTGVAAIRLGRRFIGIERDPKFAEMARSRIHAEEQQTSVSAENAGQIPLFRK